MKPLLVLIAGEQESLRSALKTLLQTRPEVEIAGVVADKEELFIQVEAHSPDLLLLDENLSINLVEDVMVPTRQIDPKLTVLVLGGRTESKKAYLDAGALTFISKGDSPKSLLTVIEEVRLGRLHV